MTILNPTPFLQLCKIASDKKKAIIKYCKRIKEDEKVSKFLTLLEECARKQFTSTTIELYDCALNSERFMEKDLLLSLLVCIST